MVAVADAPVREVGRPGVYPAALSASALLTLLALGSVGAAALALVGAPAPVVLGLPLLAHVAGLLAGWAVTVLLLLMARVPALERGVGADRMARWHALLGRTTLILLVVHGVAATLAWAAVQGIGPLAATAQVLAMPGLMAATVGSGLFVLIGVLSARAARRRLRYETWHTVHLLTYLAIALSFAHELAGPDLAGHRLVQIVWSCLYTVAFALLLRFRLLEPVVQAFRHRIRVAQVIPEADGVVSVIVSGRHLDDLRAEPGQFFRWRFLTRSTWRTAHPFSLSAPARNDFLRLTVKAVGDGTRTLQGIRPGTRLVA